tara:strand:- start:1429 stop:2379 length:951 start_codon:yes stop_codon:yes gene_type:complete
MESSKQFLESSKEFLSSNSFIAKISFIILVIIAFILLFNFSYWIMNMFLTPSKSPYLVSGMKDAKTLKIVSQDPRQNGSVPIFRSNNQYNGIEMTWSSWIYIDDPTYGQNNHLADGNRNVNPVFVKGSNSTSGSTMGVMDDSMGGAFKNSNSPGVYLQTSDNVTSESYSNENSNLIKMNMIIMVDIFPYLNPDSNTTLYNQSIPIPGIPIKKWVSVILRFSTQNILDIFINGSLNKRVKLYNSVRQNYEDVFINPDGGYDGFLSNLRYFDYSIGTFEINQIVSSGPNLTIPQDSNLKNANPYYLSTKWMFGENNVS